ncbi:nitroreductase family deazaflavin-dependent oxidoreductase [Amycolatopsis sp. WAC 04197]|nr:nitroreductase family deazaflavin-dependent oxidoreductase [Amycolatopsis sp. WAC 04197]
MNAILWKIMIRLAPKRWFIRFMRTFLVPADRFLLKRTNGRFSLGGTTGAGTLLLTTTGRRTGKHYSSPLFFTPYGDAVAVVASNYGDRKHPQWSENLLADPRATVTLGSRVFPVTARLLTGEDHESLWRLITSYGPAYQDYLTTSGRGKFRIFALDEARPSS